MWQRKGEGDWFVSVDFGIPTPAAGALRPREFRSAEVHGILAPSTGTAARAELFSADAGLGALVGRDGLAAVYRACGTSDLRVYRPGDPPFVGRGGIAALSEATGTAAVEWRPTQAAASSGGDLGYTLGSYRAPSKPGRLAASGFYLHVWKRLPEGWRLAVEVTNAGE